MALATEVVGDFLQGNHAYILFSNIGSCLLAALVPNDSPVCLMPVVLKVAFLL